MLRAFINEKGQMYLTDGTHAESIICDPKKLNKMIITGLPMPDISGNPMVCQDYLAKRREIMDQLEPTQSSRFIYLRSLGDYVNIDGSKSAFITPISDSGKQICGYTTLPEATLEEVFSDAPQLEDGMYHSRLRELKNRLIWNQFT